jgi:hypothetical protein
MIYSFLSFNQTKRAIEHSLLAMMIEQSIAPLPVFFCKKIKQLINKFLIHFLFGLYHFLPFFSGALALLPRSPDLSLPTSSAQHTIMSAMTTPSDLYPIVVSFLEANGKKKAAQKLRKEANLVRFRLLIFLKL